MPTPPNLLSDIFRIEDQGTRAAAKSLWDAVNATRAQLAKVQQDISSLQAQDVATSAELASVGVQGLATVVSSLNSRVETANDHPYVFLSNSVNQAAASGAIVNVNWDVETIVSGSGFHSVSAASDIVAIGRRPGVWLSTVQIIWAAAAGGDRNVGMVGTSPQWVSTTPPAAVGTSQVPLTAILVSRGADERVQIQVMQNSGGPINILANSLWCLYYLGPFATGQRNI